MTEVLESISVPAPPIKHDDSCPFCNAPYEDQEDKDSKIGKDIDAGELEDNLAANGEPRADVGFRHADYGKYSAEPHHLVPGNEALKGHEIEQWLAVEASGSNVKKDSGFNVNDEWNGKWLPSVTDKNRICKWETRWTAVGSKRKKRRFPAISEVGKKRLGKLTMREKDLISFAIMINSGMQFHNGNHRNKGEKPSQCYIKEAKRLLSEIAAFVIGSAMICPETEPDNDEKFPPPKWINQMIYGLASAHMRWHVTGPPESWFVFISKLARRCYQEAIDEGKTPWDIPYPGHPDRS